MRALVELLEPEVGAQVRGLVEGLLPPKPVSPALLLPRMLKLLHAGLYDTETELIREVDEVEGRVERAKATVVEEEAALAGVQGKLQGIKDQILAALREEADCRERTRKGGTDSDGKEDAVTVDEGGSSGEVGTEVERIRGGRSFGGGGFLGGMRLLVRR